MQAGSSTGAVITPQQQRERFVAAVRSLPPGQRLAYVNQHPQEYRLLMQDPDGIVALQNALNGTR